MRRIVEERLKLSQIRDLMWQNGNKTGYYFARSDGETWFREKNVHIPDTTCWYWCEERAMDGLRFINEY